MFVKNKLNIKAFLTSNKSYIYNIDVFSEKVISSESREKYAQIKCLLWVKTDLNKHANTFLFVVWITFGCGLSWCFYQLFGL